jgi:hypothetical protein
MTKVTKVTKLIEGARALRADEVLALSSGAITKPDSYNYRTMKPERGGLYCEDIFGPSKLIAESEASTSKGGGVVKRAVRLDVDDRKERWGHIELPEPPIAHPLLTEEKDASLITHVLVIPPAYRCFIRRSPAESREQATKRRAELLAMIEDPNWVGDCKAGTDRPDKLLIEEGLDDEAAIQKLGVTWYEPPLNGQYRALVNDSHRTRRLRELGAPDELVDQERSQLITRLGWLFEELLLTHATQFGDDHQTLRALSLSR